MGNWDVSKQNNDGEPCEDAISRQAAIDAIRKDVMGGLNYEGILTRLPPVTPTKCIAKITLNEKKMQEMVNNAANRIYECCEDAISRHTAMETFARWAEFKDYTHVERHILHAVVDEIRAMPSFAETMAEMEEQKAELAAELATKTCNKQITSKLEDAELARDPEETCNNKQVISKLVAS